MLDKLLNRAVEWLRDSGMEAAGAYPAAPVDRKGRFIRLGVKSARAASGGLGCYLGTKREPDGSETELYGLKCTLALSLDAYSAESPDGCVQDMEKALEALSLMPGLSMLGFGMGESVPDADTGMFRCSGSMDCGAVLTYASGEGAPEFRDFVLEGELSK